MSRLSAGEPVPSWHSQNPIVSTIHEGGVALWSWNPHARTARLDALARTFWGVELDGEVQCCLAAEGREQGFWSFAADDLCYRLYGEWFDIRRVRELRVGHDGCRVRVRQDDAIPLVA